MKIELRHLMRIAESRPHVHTGSLPAWSPRLECRLMAKPGQLQTSRTYGEDRPQPPPGYWTDKFGADLDRHLGRL
jgi:hypothetical protein